MKDIFLSYHTGGTGACLSLSCLEVSPCTLSILVSSCVTVPMMNTQAVCLFKLIILDEFANIGKTPDFDKLTATIRSQEISVAIILQSQSHLKSLYKDAGDIIVDNCDTFLSLGGKGKSTIKELSELLGRETIGMYNTSVTKRTQESHGQHVHKLGSELLAQDEVAVMDGAYPKNAFDLEKYMCTMLKAKADDVFELDVKEPDTQPA